MLTVSLVPQGGDLTASAAGDALSAESQMSNGTSDSVVGSICCGAGSRPRAGWIHCVS